MKVIPRIELCAGNKISYETLWSLRWYVKYVNGTLAKDPLPMQNDVPSRTFYLGKWRLQWPIWLPNLTMGWLEIEEIVQTSKVSVTVEFSLNKTEKDYSVRVHELDFIPISSCIAQFHHVVMN